ncbi:hypothetical protein TBLA_0B04430 [Henningerozyma blattae CBS 6284]|uniref:Elongator complex protein 4 n=1 Tax=Henningerozyma blattae (strain ATCC 34711 / CBS 6284 / DSM 70876 / NBRC 10599 / NRRL Y-10934 / UCD 77-7) TaxID=1071380 RepID=I2GYS8_HENB6|nr:hypothetical protein TBLA_0B04430 [Tetrapisispora blattae CBS 6284]CCH59280.1 hypothetical protein TBLA_0B04430 [Tetrapisispora blattae CBS 6284]
MSFRKRSEVVNTRGPGLQNARGPTQDSIQNARGIPANTRGMPVNARSPVPARGPQLNTSRGRNVPSLNNNNPSFRGRLSQRMSNMNINDDSNSHLNNHPGIRPSPATSQLTTSTGCNDLDSLLGHMGLPLGNSLLIEEIGTTDFNSVLCKLFASQGIIHNRLKNGNSQQESNTHVIVLSLNKMWGKELPGTYKGSKKDIKKQNIANEQSKISVSNLNEQSSTPSRYKDLKIAWRYGLKDEIGQKNSKSTNQDSTEYKDYNHQFDITSRLIPTPTSDEITYIPTNIPVSSILTQLTNAIDKNPTKLIRIIIPSLMHPSMYSPNYFKLTEIIPLLHGIKSIIKQNESRCVLLASCFTNLLQSSISSSKLLLNQIQSIFDSIVLLEPFQQEMIQLLEKSYKTQPNKIQHGLIHILKLPAFSEKGEMCVSRSEYAFRNGRKNFEIEEWGIPVEDVEEDENKDNNVDSSASNIGNPNNKPKKSTKVDLEF